MSKITIKESELRRIILEAVDGKYDADLYDASDIYDTGAQKPALTPQQVDHKVEQQLMKLNKGINKNTDIEDYWRNCAKKEFPKATEGIKSSDWKAVYADLFRKKVMGKPTNKVPAKLTKTAVTEKPKGFSTKTMAGQLMDMLFSNFISTERKGGATSHRDEFYKALKSFEFKTNPMTATQNTAGGAWLTSGNRNKEVDNRKKEFIKLSDAINACYNDICEYISYNAQYTKVADLRGIIEKVSYKLKDLNKLINETDVIERLIGLAEDLMRSAEPSQRKFYMGDNSGKNIGILHVLQAMKKYSYQIPQVLNKLENFIDNGTEWDVSSGGRIWKTMKESIMTEVKKRILEESKKSRK